MGIPVMDPSPRAPRSPRGAGTPRPGCLSPCPWCHPRWDGCSWPQERGGGQRVSGQRWRKRAVTTSCSGFKRKCLAAAAGCFPQPPASSFPPSLDGGSQLRGWEVGAEPQWALSLGGQAGLPMELHPSGCFAWKGCSPHEQLAWMLAPNPV